MAKKKAEIKEVENVDIEALVDEGKNVDTVKAAEVIADNTEDAPEEEANEGEEDINVEDMIQEAKDAQADEIIKGIMEETDEVSGEEVEDEECGEEVEDEEEERDWKPEKDDEEFEEDSNIDDVIAECTGEADEKAQTKKESVKEPWYVSRAKRIGDYYNW